MVSSTTRRARGSQRASVTGVDTWLLTLVADGATQRVAEAVAPAELTVDQWRVLDYLAYDGPCTMSRLAAATNINGATLTRLTDHLISRALVYRVADELDRRRVLVRLADHGRRTVRRVRPRVLAAEADATAALAPEEREQLVALLRRVAPADAARIHRDWSTPAEQ